MRASRSQWSISPETIMSHHYRLARGVPSVVDSRPPYSMYNSPISVHYIPKRASSADLSRRKPLSKSQRELTAFVNGHSSNLRLPLPLRSSLNDLTKPKLLNNRNYQPPRKKKASYPKYPVIQKDTDNELILTKFKDDVLSQIISADNYTDKFILNVIKVQKEKLAGIVAWNELENAAMELLEHLDVRPTRKKVIDENISNRMETLSISSTSTSSSSTSMSSSSSSTGSSSSTIKSSANTFSSLEDN